MTNLTKLRSEKSHKDSQFLLSPISFFPGKLRGELLWPTSCTLYSWESEPYIGVDQCIEMTWFPKSFWQWIFWGGKWGFYQFLIALPLASNILCMRICKRHVSVKQKCNWIFQTLWKERKTNIIIFLRENVYSVVKTITKPIGLWRKKHLHLLHCGNPGHYDGPLKAAVDFGADSWPFSRFCEVFWI